MEEDPKPINSFKVFMGMLVILVLILGGIYLAKYFYTPINPTRLIYNNFEFQKYDGIWHTNWQRDGQVYDVGLRFNPKEVETVPVSGRLNSTFERLPFYITFNPEEEPENFKYIALGVAELGLSLVRGLGGQIETACTQNVSEACVDRPILTCDNDDKAIFYLKIADEPRVTLDGNCLILEGKEFELIRAIDRVLYHFYKIMP